ncbi:MAG TPA: DUF445 domain-containing protein [Gemmatimonadales bacterium]|nr:DUF445 domain-containing protein [Gemmatimonadales bacterium]
MTQNPPVPAPDSETVPPPTPPSLWVRPDDALRQESLDRMKRRATGLLALAAVVFVVATFLEPGYPWLGWVRAAAEASLVGGLADWFAVTALFRHPLGIPIPHTAIVATRKERIGRVLGNFVQNHFLSHEVVAHNLRAVRPAQRAARWLSDPVNAARVARQVAGGLARAVEAVPDGDARDLVRKILVSRLRTVRAAPALGKTLSLVLEGDRQQGLLNVAVRLAADAVEKNREVIRAKVKAQSPWWVPGVVDEKIYERILATVESLLRDIAADPDHELRGTFDAALHQLADRLQYSPDLIERAEAMKETWLEDPAVGDLSARVWEGLRGAVVVYAGAGSEGPAGPLERGIAEFGNAILADEALLADLDEAVIDVVAGVVERYRHEIGDLIARTVAGWDPDATSRRFELAVGRDLQFVRINGTLVGALVGLAIYAVMRLWG